MERVDIGAIFKIKNIDNLNLAEEVVDKIVSLSSLERSTLFLFLVEKKDLYLTTREVTEKLRTKNLYKSNVIFLTVYNEKKWNDTVIKWCSSYKPKLLFLWGGKEDKFDEIDNLTKLYIEHPSAGLIKGCNGSYMTKPKHLAEEYCRNFSKRLESLGYKNYNLEMNEE